MISVGRKKGRLIRGHIPGGGRGAAVNAAVAVGPEDQLELRLPDFHVLRLVARSLLALALVSFYLLRSSSHQAPVTDAAATGKVPSPQTDDAFLLPMLFRDLKRQGLLPPGARATFLGRDAGARLSHVLRQNGIELVAGCESGGECRGVIPDRTLDFVFSDVRSLDVEFIDRAVKIGGVVAVRLSSDGAGNYRMASNYKIVYIRKFGSTVVAMRKFVDPTQSAVTSVGRRLLAVLDGTRKEALKGLEDVLLEPPAGRMARGRYLKRTKYLPDLTGDTLNDNPRRVFVDVSTGSQRKPSAGAGTGPGCEVGGAARWFARNYPTRNRNFEVIRVEVMTEGAAAGGRAEEDMSGWLRRNAREEEYVVMKAEAGVVEGIVRSSAVGLVDELFLECRHGGRAAGRRRRAYWECLSLYGELRDAGVAVHQWWWDARLAACSLSNVLLFGLRVQTTAQLDSVGAQVVLFWAKDTGIHHKPQLWDWILGTSVAHNKAKAARDKVGAPKCAEIVDIDLLGASSGGVVCILGDIGALLLNDGKDFAVISTKDYVIKDKANIMISVKVNLLIADVGLNLESSRCASDHLAYVHHLVVLLNQFDLNSFKLATIRDTLFQIFFFFSTLLLLLCMIHDALFSDLLLAQFLLIPLLLFFLICFCFSTPELSLTAWP
ncbi:hypothetical protein Taro_051616 [Colocasia esculenta]|uniref:DUF7870 domain-containing protein n=1 Tax=Colocasia esculenta TaxID=4460 RepID=A0A843XGJ4_COLES|nr:hypothetical protein [Colocasia esculenta]